MSWNNGLLYKMSGHISRQESREKKTTKGIGASNYSWNFEEQHICIQNQENRQKDGQVQTQQLSTTYFLPGKVPASFILYFIGTKNRINMNKRTNKRNQTKPNKTNQHNKSNKHTGRPCQKNDRRSSSAAPLGLPRCIPGDDAPSLPSSATRPVERGVLAMVGHVFFFF